MSIRSQAEVENQYHQRMAQVQSHAITPQQALGKMEDWIIQLGQRKAILRPDLMQWMWYDRLHDYWAPAGCGPDGAILLTVGRVGGIKKLLQPDEVAGWCVYVYQQGQELFGPVRIEELLNMLKSQQAPMNILVWSPLATSWLSVVYETGEAISFYDEAGNPISLVRSAPQKPSPPENLGQTKPPANTPRRPPPPEKL